MPLPRPAPSSKWPFVAVIAIVAVFLAYVSHVKKGESSGGTSPVALPSAGAPVTPPPLSGPGTFYPSQGHDHWDESRLATFLYNSNPPTSGPHEEVFAPGYIMDAPLTKAIQAHLLEHGNILIQYRCTCPSLVKKLSSLAQSFDTYNPQMAMEMGKAVLIAPNKLLDHRIVLTAWTRLLPLNHYDDAAIKQFVTAWLGNDRNSRQ